MSSPLNAAQDYGIVSATKALTDTSSTSPTPSGCDISPEAISPSIKADLEPSCDVASALFSPSVVVCSPVAESPSVIASFSTLNREEEEVGEESVSQRAILFPTTPPKEDDNPSTQLSSEVLPELNISGKRKSEVSMTTIAGDTTTVVVLTIEAPINNAHRTPIVVATKGTYIVNGEVDVDCGRGGDTYGDADEEGAALLPPKDEIIAEPKPMRTAFFTMFPVFMAYAALVTLQGDLKSQIGIPNGDSALSSQYSFAVSLCYLGNLIFRLLHNILFCMFTPRQRVYISYLCLITAISTIAIVYYWLSYKHIGFVYGIYLLGGVGIGTFESNLISVITPLGHGTKKWAQMGIPLGFNGISVGAFILFSFYPQCSALQGGVYTGIAVANVLGLIFFAFAIPDIHFESSAKSLKGFWEDCKCWKSWVPKLGFHSFSLMVDMFCVSFISAIQQYIYTSSELPLFSFGPLSMERTTARIPKNVHRSVFNFASLIGDACGRKIAYGTKRHINPLFFLFFSALGVFLVLSKQSLLAPFGMLFVMFANGSIYAFTTKYIDDNVDRSFNLIGLSFWLFIGDVGSFTGANIVSPIQDLIGSE